MVRVKKFVLGPLATNTYIVYDNDAGDALVVDLGGFSEDLAAWIRSLGLEVRAIVATHGHIDHVYGVDLFKSVFDSVLVIHREDVETLENNGILCKALSLDCPSISPDKLIDREGVYRFGSVEVEVIHVPGHTPGSIAIYIPQLNMLLSGDTLFAGSVGRTDLPGGSEEKLLQSLCRLAKMFKEDTKVLPGHGPATFLGRELRTNMFLIKAIKVCNEG